MESKGTKGKGFALPTTFATIFEPIAKVTKGKDVEWVNKLRLPKIWLKAPRSRIHNLRDEDFMRWEIELLK